jgi:hypothetical protein
MIDEVLVVFYELFAVETAQPISINSEQREHRQPDQG